MERELITEEELVAILNLELSKLEDTKNIQFTSGVMRLRGTDENGCNWSSVQLRGSGVPIEPITHMAERIVAEAKRKYNLR